MIELVHDIFSEQTSRDAQSKPSALALPLRDRGIARVLYVDFGSLLCASIT